MKKLIKNLAWKVPICLMWYTDSPYYVRGSNNFWDVYIIAIIFLFGLDLIKWGLKEE